MKRLISTILAVLLLAGTALGQTLGGHNSGVTAVQGASGPPPAQFTQGSDQPAPAGNNTTALQMPTTVLTGKYYSQVWGAVGLLLGATPPTSITLGFAYYGQSSFQTLTVPVGMLVANANLIIPFAVQTPDWNTANQYSIMTVNVLAAGQAVTIKAGTSSAIETWSPHS